MRSLHEYNGVALACRHAVEEFPLMSDRGTTVTEAATFKRASCALSSWLTRHNMEHGSCYRMEDPKLTGCTKDLYAAEAR